MGSRSPRIAAFRTGLAVLVAAALGACAGAGSSTPPTGRPTVQGPPRAVVIDTDMAEDDWLAILYLLGRPEVTVAAITVTGTGEAHCEAGVRHALDLAALAGQPEIPVACGRETPLAGDHAFPPAWRQRVDALSGLSLPENPRAPASTAAVDLLASALESSSAGVTFLSLGPLTNLAEFLTASPELVGRIDAMYVMGGAVAVDGNVAVSGAGIDNRFAEWNVYVDPTAADVVLRSGARVTLVPLDATSHVPVTIGFVDRLAADAGTPQATFASQVLDRSRDFIASGGYFFWDPFAAAVQVDETLTSFQTGNLRVVVVEGPESGRIVAADDGVPTRYATTGDLARFEQLFLDTINDRSN